MFKKIVLHCFMSQIVKNHHFFVNSLLKKKNCFVNILRTDRDISKLLTDSNSAKLRLSVVKNSKNYCEGLYRTVKKPKI